MLDIVLLLLVVLFGYSGYRQGFIVGALSFVGFLGGAVLGAVIAPPIVREIVETPSQRALLAVAVVFLAATLGQFLASTIGALVRSRVTWDSAQLVDAIGGAAISVVSVLLVAWLIGNALVNSPIPWLTQQTQRSQVLHMVDRVMPEAARTWFKAFQDIVEASDFPQVFAGLGNQPLVDVPAPDPKVLNTKALRAARRSVVKVTGTAPDCQRHIEGTGFVFDRERVMTNAHVVAGVRGGPTILTLGGGVYKARVVVYDPSRDVAVLYVPGLRTRPLDFDDEAKTGDSAVVAGFPRNHGFTAVAGRVRAKQTARGLDIYESQHVSREIYALRAKVEPGNSGGPLLAPNGDVYGVVFAAAVGDPDTGYALTADEVASDARRGIASTRAVSTQACD
ncbi:MAG: MarP family serine protease [Streptosporangiales bacterium]|nr:MarP family serine protease [Streptosporangiales bacterium]